MHADAMDGNETYKDTGRIIVRIGEHVVTGSCYDPEEIPPEIVTEFSFSKFQPNQNMPVENDTSADQSLLRHAKYLGVDVDLPAAELAAIKFNREDLPKRPTKRRKIAAEDNTEYKLPSDLLNTPEDTMELRSELAGIAMDDVRVSNLTNDNIVQGMITKGARLQSYRKGLNDRREATYSVFAKRQNIATAAPLTSSRLLHEIPSIPTFKMADILPFLRSAIPPEPACAFGVDCCGYRISKHKILGRDGELGVPMRAFTLLHMHPKTRAQILEIARRIEPKNGRDPSSDAGNRTIPQFCFLCIVHAVCDFITRLTNSSDQAISWMQPFQVVIGPEEFPMSHVIMSIGKRAIANSAPFPMYNEKRWSAVVSLDGSCVVFILDKQTADFHGRAAFTVHTGQYGDGFQDTIPRLPSSCS